MPNLEVNPSPGFRDHPEHTITVEPFDGVVNVKFRDVMIDSHKEAVSLFEGTAKDAKDPDVKSFAAKMLPTLQHHKDQAKALPNV